MNVLALLVWQGSEDLGGLWTSDSEVTRHVR